VGGLTNFLKTSDKAADEELDEFLAMKFNMTKSDSSIFMRAVLGHSRSDHSKANLIEKFAEKIGKQVAILDKNKIQECYLELTTNVLGQYTTVDEFFQKCNFEKPKLVHHYLIEKALTKALKYRQEKVPSFDLTPVLEVIVTHLLNQSRNFYQIETKVLKENLVKNLQAAQKQANERRHEKVAPEKKEEEYDYYEEDDILDEEERKLIEVENTQRDAVFKQAMEKLKQGGDDASEMSL